MPMRDDRGPIDREILDIIPERFDADPDSRHARKSAHTRLILTIALALLAIAALGVAARHILFGEAPKEIQAGVPVIHADERPVKTRPQDRGGMDVPNQDKLVYEKMGAGEAEPQSERLLPPPEQPQTPPPQQPRTPSIKPAFPVPPLKETPAAARPGLTEMAPMPPPPAAAPQPQVTSVKPAQQMAATAPAAGAPTAAPPPAAAKPASAAAPAPAAAAKPMASGAWLVQLGALKTDAEAKNEWGRVKGAHKDLLGEFSSDIMRVDLGAKGIFWRLRAGPMDEAQARTLCAALAKQSQGCLVVKK